MKKQEISEKEKAAACWDKFLSERQSFFATGTGCAVVIIIWALLMTAIALGIGGSTQNRFFDALLCVTLLFGGAFGWFHEEYCYKTLERIKGDFRTQYPDLAKLTFDE